MGVMETWLEPELEEPGVRSEPLSPVQELPQFTFRRRRTSVTSSSGISATLLSPSPQPSRVPPSQIAFGVNVGRRDSGTMKLESEVENEAAEGNDSATAGVAVRVLVRCRPLLDASRARLSIFTEGSSSGQVSISLQAPPDLGSPKRMVATPGRAAQSPRHSRGTSPMGSPSSSPKRNSRRSVTSIEADGSVTRTYLCNSFCSESSSQEDVFSHASPIVDRVMEGYNGTIFCYGITGSGKTFTMSGPPKDKGACPDPNMQGIVQRSAWRIFEYISQRSQQGEVFAVEASFLEIYSSDGHREVVMDLLAEEKSAEKPEIKQDPLCPQSFICEGLRKVPINSPDAMNEALEAGRRRCTFMETSRNCLSSRSHCLFVVTVECLIDSENGLPPVVKRGKLVLVDLAGSESLKKVMASSESNEELRRKQAIGINRVLSHLGSVVNNLNLGFQNASGYRNSALTMLLRDCLGGSARALLVANIGPEAEWSSETFTTLTFAQQMMQIRNVEKAVVVDHEKSVLVQMRQRHEECIRRLREETISSDATPKEREERVRLQSDLDDLNGRLLTKRKATETLETLQEEHRRKMDAMREEMTEHMKVRCNSIQGSLVQDIQGLQQAIETKAREEGEIAEKRFKERHEAAVTSVQTELQSTVEATKLVESDVAQLRVQLAAAEEKAKTLQELQHDAVRDREALEKERRELADQASDQLRRIAELEGEMQKHRSEGTVLQAEAERLTTARAQEVEAFRLEKENWQSNEAKMEDSLQQAKLELDEHQKLLEEAKKQAEMAHRAEIDGLKAQASELEASSTSRRLEYEEVKDKQARLESDVRACRESEATLRRQCEQEVHDYEDKIDAANQNINEILNMLHQVQSSIMHATKSRTDIQLVQS